MRPPVTALLPIKNGQIWIPRMMENLKSCLESHDQLVIVDDHSQDNSWELFSELKFDFDFKLVSNPGHGLVSALNYGISIAEHEWIARFDVDDEYPSERIDLQLLDLDEKVVAIFGDYVFVDSSGRELGVLPSPVFPAASSLSLIHSDRTAHPSAIFRKQAAIEAGLYREIDFPSEDLSLWIRLASIGELRTVPKTVLKYTLHTASISTSRYREAKERTQELIDSLVDFNSIANSCEKDFFNCIHSYSNLSYSRERKVLFLRDLFSKQVFIKFSRKFQLKLITYSLALFSNPQTLFSLLKLYLEKNRRRIIRFT